MSRGDRIAFGELLAESMKSKYDDELECCDEDGQCSDENGEKIEELLETCRKQRRQGRIKRIFAGVAVAMLMLFSGITVYAYGDEIGRLIEKAYNGFVEVQFEKLDGDVLDKIYECYDLSYLPDGYRQIFGLENGMVNKKEWRNEGGEHIIFTQTVLDSVLTFEDDESKTEILHHDKYRIYCRRCDSCYVYLWNDGKYFLSIDSSSELDPSELFSIVDGMISEQ